LTIASVLNWGFISAPCGTLGVVKASANGDMPPRCLWEDPDWDPERAISSLIKPEEPPRCLRDLRDREDPVWVPEREESWLINEEEE
jgi:hypothetical protein